jgi:hypothetical protein
MYDDNKDNMEKEGERRKGKKAKRVLSYSMTALRRF